MFRNSVANDENGLTAAAVAHVVVPLEFQLGLNGADKMLADKGFDLAKRDFVGGDSGDGASDLCTRHSATP